MVSLQRLSTYISYIESILNIQEIEDSKWKIRLREN